MAKHEARRMPKAAAKGASSLGKTTMGTSVRCAASTRWLWRQPGASRATQSTAALRLSKSLPTPFVPATNSCPSLQPPLARACLRCVRKISLHSAEETRSPTRH